MAFVKTLHALHVSNRLQQHCSYRSRGNIETLNPRPQPQPLERKTLVLLATSHLTTSRAKKDASSISIRCARSRTGQRSFRGVCKGLELQESPKRSKLALISDKSSKPYKPGFLSAQAICSRSTHQGVHSPDKSYRHDDRQVLNENLCFCGFGNVPCLVQGHISRAYWLWPSHASELKLLKDG